MTREGTREGTRDVARDVARAASASVVAATVLSAVVAVLAVGCGVAPSAGVSAEPVREVVPAWKVRAEGGMTAIDPGLPADSLLDARGCASCHAAIVDEWSRSRHAQAWTNSIFQTEYSARPQAWCVNCHAPLTTQQVDLAGPRAAQGVDCATCHVRAGTLVAKTRRAGSPHETIGDPTFGSPAFCGDCHQFTFPVLSDEDGAALSMTRHPMQNTVASFRAGPYARERDGCLSCHGSRHGHAFAGGHDRGMLEGALDVAWCRALQPPAAASAATEVAAGEIAAGEVASPASPVDDPSIRVTVRNAAAGHTVPTGDIHRHMYLRVWRSSAPEALFQAYFGRRFDPADDGGKSTSWDSTLAPGASKAFQIPVGKLGGELDEPVNLELVYVYIVNEFPRVGLGPDEPTTASIVRWRATPAELAACVQAK